MTEIVATSNIVASQGPEQQPTATVMSGGCLEVVGRVSGRYLEGVWREFGRCLDNIKMVNRGCLEAKMQFQLKDKESQDRSS